MDGTIIYRGGPERRGEMCRCGRCGVEEVCRPGRDFYVLEGDPLGPLLCEDCMTAHALSEAAKLRKDLEGSGEACPGGDENTSTNSKQPGRPPELQRTSEGRGLGGEGRVESANLWLVCYDAMRDRVLSTKWAGAPLNREGALNLAAWIVCLCDPTGEEFDKLREEIRRA